MNIFIACIIIGLIISIAFLTKELLKKFGFWKQFQERYSEQISWVHHGDQKPGMYTLELRGNGDFQALVGFDFSLGPIQYGFDIFGHLQSQDGVIRCSVYLGKGPVKLIFLLDKISKEAVSIILIGKTNEHVVYTFHPHWWQRIGFYG